MGGVGIVLILVIGILIIWVMYTFNRFVAKQSAIDTIWDEADIHLKLRHTLVPILVDTAEPLMKDEKDLLDRIARLPEAITSAETIEETERLENELSNLLAELRDRVKNYDNLLLNQNFIRLMGELVSMEGRAATACDQHNKLVYDFNRSIRQFPANLVVGFLHFHPCEMRIFGTL